VGILFRCDREIGCTFELWDRTVSLEQWLESSAKLVADPDWPTGRRHLTDLRTGDTVSAIHDSDLKEISELFSIYAERVAGLKLAMVAEKNQRRPELFAQVVFGIGVEAAVFRSLEEACAWLNVDLAQTESILLSLRAQLRPGTTS
jgi:hypothetical protein